MKVVLKQFFFVVFCIICSVFPIIMLILLYLEIPKEYQIAATLISWGVLISLLMLFTKNEKSLSLKCICLLVYLTFALGAVAAFSYTNSKSIEIFSRGKYSFYIEENSIFQHELVLKRVRAFPPSFKGKNVVSLSNCEIDDISSDDYHIYVTVVEKERTILFTIDKDSLETREEVVPTNEEIWG
ncbi:MAG: hypothetical protein GXY08_09975 [Ruminococcus sp.]|nr:hypothetical protein [Ruminococcus sp.]